MVRLKTRFSSLSLWQISLKKLNALNALKSNQLHWGRPISIPTVLTRCKSNTTTDGDRARDKLASLMKTI